MEEEKRKYSSSDLFSSDKDSDSYSSDTDSYSESVSDLESDSYSSSSSSDGRNQKKRSRKSEGHQLRKNKDKREIGGGQRSKKSRHHSRWSVFIYKLFILFVLFAHLSLNFEFLTVFLFQKKFNCLKEHREFQWYGWWEY